MALNECMCWKSYTCLYCEDIAEGRRKPTGERVRALSISRLVAECGTRAGYNKHRRDGEPACAECKSAQNEAVKKYMRERASK